MKTNPRREIRARKFSPEELKKIVATFGPRRVKLRAA
jgi:hypothetical protein